MRGRCVSLQKELDEKDEDLNAKDQAVVELTQALDRAMGGVITEFLLDTAPQEDGVIPLDMMDEEHHELQ